MSRTADVGVLQLNQNLRGSQKLCFGAHTNTGRRVLSFSSVPISPPATGARWPGKTIRYRGLAAPARPILWTGTEPFAANLRSAFDACSTEYCGGEGVVSR